jgi:drug/metabolite transporter (DMT)-like permease
MPRRNPSLTPDVWLALFGVYLVWGSTYLAIRFAVATFPPFLMAGSRFLLAGSLLFLFMIIRGARFPTLRHWKSASIVGFLLVFCSNGGVSWGEREVPSGVAALLVATVPLWMAVLAWLWKKGRRPEAFTWWGILLGLAGVGLLGGTGWLNRGGSKGGWGIVVLSLSPVTWAIGSLYARDADLPPSSFLSTSMEMITGGFFQMTGALLLEETRGFHLSQISSLSWASWGYLVFIGSLVGFTSYIWVLHKATPLLASTYAYVNPVIAVLLGWFFAGENLTPVMGLASLLILMAVMLITFQNVKNTDRTKSH